jgi:hypothetical protein
VTYYRRRDLTDTEWFLAGAIAAATAAVTFYLTRIWLQREVLDKRPPERLASDRDAEGAETTSP